MPCTAIGKFGKTAISDLDCDYLVLGAGPAALAFVDSLLAGSKKKRTLRVAIINERDQPGGYWNDIHDYASHHGEDAHYGISSLPLEPWDARAKGPHYSSPKEMQVYFQRCLKFLINTGCVKYFPMCKYEDGKLVSMLDTDATCKVFQHCKVVSTDRTMESGVMTGTPNFKVDKDVHMVTPKSLTTLSSPYSKFVVLGCGRSSVDVICWLIDHGIPPHKISWVVPRDQWFRVYECMVIKNMCATCWAFRQAVWNSNTYQEQCQRMQDLGIITCVDPTICVGQAFHGSSIGAAELAKVRQVTDIIRLGHVTGLRKFVMELEQGSVPVYPNTLFVDCTSTKIRDQPPAVPIFSRNQIVLQAVGELFTGIGEMSFSSSAAGIGWLESLDKTDTWKNKAFVPMPYPDTAREWYKFHLQQETNPTHSEVMEMRSWVVGDRLSQFSSFTSKELQQITDPKEGPAAKMPLIVKLTERCLELEAGSCDRDIFMRKCSGDSTSTAASSTMCSPR